jgi:tRNA threonylcarbamoyladenosine biosynthesis protein TsaE
MQTEFITTKAGQTQKLGELLAEEILADKKSSLKNAKSLLEVGPQKTLIICLSGNLGSGKTTFTQGLLKGLKVKGPYTSPTFVIMKKYKDNIYHFDAYRVSAIDILNLGWNEIISDFKNIIIVEWAERVKKIIPKNALWIKFKWVNEDKRKIIFEK